MWSTIRNALGWWIGVSVLSAVIMVIGKAVGVPVFNATIIILGVYAMYKCVHDQINAKG